MTELVKPVKRRTVNRFLHYRLPLIVELKPGDYVGLRLLHHRREVVFSLHDLYFEGVRRQVASERKAKKLAKRSKR